MCVAMSDSLSSLNDPDLLKRFCKTQCEAAFGELVERYGKLVMGVCLRVLKNRHDAEDAFQATFLVLAEKAGKIKTRDRRSLPSWLCGVAYRLSMNLARKHHRKDLALTAEPVAARDQFSDLEQRFDEQAVDEELHALPGKYRDVLVRFYFLGQTSRQIAEALGITQGAADGRIKRGRQELRVRLAKRGVALGALTVMALSTQTASATVAPAIAQSVVQAAAAQSTAGLLSPSVVKLAGTELMKTSSMSLPAVVVVAVSVLLAAGTFGLNGVLAQPTAGLMIDTKSADAEAGSAPAVVVGQQKASGQNDPRGSSKTYGLDASINRESLATLLKSVRPKAPIKLGADGVFTLPDGFPQELLEKVLLRLNVPLRVQSMSDTYVPGNVTGEELTRSIVQNVDGVFPRFDGSRLTVQGATEKAAKFIAKADPAARRVASFQLVKAICPAVTDQNGKVLGVLSPKVQLPPRRGAGPVIGMNITKIVTKKGEEPPTDEELMKIGGQQSLAKVSLRPPRQATAKLSVNARSVVIKWTEKAIKTLDPSTDIGGRTVYAVDQLKFSTPSGAKVSVDEARKSLDGKTSLAILEDWETVLPASYLKSLKPSTLVITLPPREVRPRKATTPRSGKAVGSEQARGQ